MSRYTLSFSLGGIRTIIHPSTWLVLLILGSSTGGVSDLPYALLFMALGVISLLIHEYGHAFSARFFGGEVQKVELSTLGGVTFFEQHQLSRQQMLLVTLAGPGSELVVTALLGAVLGLFAGGNVAGGILFALVYPLSLIIPALEDPLISALQPLLHGLADLGLPHDFLRIFILFFAINVIWGIFNLLPILPLDGGRVLSLLLNNYKKAALIGIVVSALVLVWALIHAEILTAFIVAWFLYINWKTYSLTIDH